MRNAILYTDLDLSDAARYSAIRVHVHALIEPIGLDDIVVLVDANGIRCWGPCTDVESSERRGFVASITVAPQASFGVVYTPH